MSSEPMQFDSYRPGARARAAARRNHLPEQLARQLADSRFAEVLSAGSNVRVVWVCEHPRHPAPHRWVATPNNRMNGRGCPNCASATRPRRKMLTHARRNPLPQRLVDELDDPAIRERVSAKSTKRVCWRCRTCSFRWWATPAHRTQTESPTGCPACYEQTRGEYRQAWAARTNPLPKALRAEAVDQATASRLGAGSAARLRWRCPKCGDTWMTEVFNRARHGCPTCGHARSAAATHRRATRRNPLPEVLRAELTRLSQSRRIAAHSHEPLKWTCPAGCGQYTATPASRSRGSTCPQCARRRQGQHKRRTAAAANPLPPSLQAQLVNARSGIHASAGSHMLLEWQCPDALHTYWAPAEQRSRGGGCTICRKRGYQKDRPGSIYLLVNDALGCAKIGISNNPQVRVQRIQHDTSAASLPGYWRVVRTWSFDDGGIAPTLEQHVLKMLRARSIPRALPRWVANYTETFPAIHLRWVVQMVVEVIAGRGLTATQGS